MTVLNPLAFALLALVPPIILLYLLKLKRQDYQVSSIYLWQRFVRDIEANAPWQRLQRNLLLLLQLIFMLLLILSLARPAIKTQTLGSQNLIFIIDTSASMGAMDEENSLGRSINRLTAAKNIATTFINNLPHNASVTIITSAGGQTNLLTAATQDHQMALNTLSSIQPTALNSNLTPAIALADALIARQPQTEIILLSDGNINTNTSLAPIRFMSVGKLDANQAISNLSLNTPNNQPPTLFVQISNYSQQTAQRRLIIKINNNPFTAFDLTIPPNNHIEKLVPILESAEESNTIEASLTPSNNDVLTIDDTAWSIMHSKQATHITLITDGNFFLQTALNLFKQQYLNNNSTVNIINSTNWQNSTKKQQNTDVYIFDGILPQQIPVGNLFFINPPASLDSLFEIVGSIETPIAQIAEPNHAILKNVSFASTKLQILSASQLSLDSWAKPLLISQQMQSKNQPIPLLMAGEKEGKRIAILAFNLHQSNLPLQPAFPILVANLINYLDPNISHAIPTQLLTDNSFVLSTAPQIDSINLSLINKNTQALANTQSFQTKAGQVTLPSFNQTGLYQLKLLDNNKTQQTIHLAVNFFNSTESAITPTLNLTNGPINPPQTTLQTTQLTWQEWWRPLTLVILILLIIEWLVYNRV